MGAPETRHHAATVGNSIHTLRSDLQWVLQAYTRAVSSAWPRLTSTSRRLSMTHFMTCLPTSRQPQCPSTMLTCPWLSAGRRPRQLCELAMAPDRITVDLPIQIIVFFYASSSSRCPSPLTNWWVCVDHIAELFKCLPAWRHCLPGAAGLRKHRKQLDIMEWLSFSDVFMRHCTCHLSKAGVIHLLDAASA